MSDPTASTPNKQTGSKFTPGVGGRGPGRPKGSKNKITAATEQNIVKTFEALGGVPQMVAWARENPTDFYTKLYVKLVPKDIRAEHSGGVDLVHEWRFGNKVIQF